MLLERHRKRLADTALTLLSIGLFFQLSGFLFNNDDSRQATQVHLLLFAPALALFIKERFSPQTWQQPCSLTFLALIGWVLARATLATDADHSTLYWIKLCILIILYIFAITHLSHKNKIHTPLLAATILSAAFSWLTLYYQFAFLDKPLNYETVRYTGRLSELGWNGFADFSHPIPAGLYYGFFSVILLSLLAERELNKLQLLLTLAGITGLLLYTLLTFSRGAWFSTLAASLTLLIISPKPRARTLLLIGTFTLLCISAIFWQQIHNEWRLGTSQRGLIWLNWLHRLPEFWLLGNGAGTEIVYRYPWGDIVHHAHSLYLQLWYEYGIIGITLFLTMLSTLLHKAWTLRELFEARIALAMLTFSIVAMISDIHAVFHRPSVYWIILWLPVGLIIGLSSPTRPAQSNEPHRKNGT